ncbi:helix-turn-helix domain-containing protein [Clostridium sp.]|uniref:helix-turn-helix domain-containing protein n=1 Tax=Clostridium sp. TaxID=1506 RepID=UPI003216F783
MELSQSKINEVVEKFRKELTTKEISSPISISEYKEKIQKKTCNSKELGSLLGISTAKARELIRIDGFPVIKIGRENRVILSKLDEWLEKNIGEVL